MHCPHGHQKARHELAQFQESEPYPCDDEVPPGHIRPCNAQRILPYVYRRENGPDGHPVRKVYVADVDWREMAHTKQQDLGVCWMVAWLGRRYDPPQLHGALREPTRAVMVGRADRTRLRWPRTAVPRAGGRRGAHLRPGGRGDQYSRATARATEALPVEE